ncbi:MAG TPA: carbohydrate kinase family protein [Gaiellaceae bacterium]|nr:carbohydrate kinase family protein [Gaiellaceae bacterium]
MRLTTLGDLILDVIVSLDGSLVPGDDRPATIRAGAGGQAANVAAWAQALGADSRLVCRRGGDPAGELAAHEVRAHGVEIVGPLGGRGGVVVSLAAGGDRTMASDRGEATGLAPGELDDAWFDCDVLHVSGYALHGGLIAEAAGAAVRAARAKGATVSLDLSTFTLADAAFAARVRDVAPDVVFANEREHETLGPLDARLVLKRGAAGIVVDGVAHEAVPTTVVDATGAGDALAAGFLVGGPALGLEAAARCCAKLGAMP